MMPQPQIGRSLPCDGSMLESALTRLANELYAAPPGGVAGGLPPLVVGAVPNASAPAGFGAPLTSASGFGAPLSPTTFGAPVSSPAGFAAPAGAAPGFPPAAPAGAGAFGATPAAPDGLGFEPALNSPPLNTPSLGAGGGTAAPAPPFPTTAGQQQSGVSLPG